MLVRLLAGPLFGVLADLLRSLRIVLACCAVLAAGTALALLASHTFWLLLIFAIVQAAALAPTTSIADALSVSAVTRRVSGGKRFEYGWIRGAASAAFVLGTLIVGRLIGPNDLSPVVWMNAALLVAAAGTSALLPPIAKPFEPRTSISQLATDLYGLFRISRFLVLILVAALIYGSHAVHDAFAVIRWSSAGIETWTISFLWSEAVAAEVVVFLLIGPALLDRFGPRGAAALAAAAGIVRWSIAAITNSVPVLCILQPMHGLTFALLHLTCMRMMASLVPTRLAATAQSSYAFGSGLVTTAVTLLSGVLYSHYGGLAFLPMAGLCCVALPFAWFGFVKHSRGEQRR